jgi:hypothetical protein
MRPGFASNSLPGSDCGAPQPEESQATDTNPLLDFIKAPEDRRSFLRRSLLMSASRFFSSANILESAIDAISTAPIATKALATKSLFSGLSQLAAAGDSFRQASRRVRGSNTTAYLLSSADSYSALAVKDVENLVQQSERKISLISDAKLAFHEVNRSLSDLEGSPLARQFLDILRQSCLDINLKSKQLLLNRIGEVQNACNIKNNSEDSESLIKILAATNKLNCPDSVLVGEQPAWNSVIERFEPLEEKYLEQSEETSVTAYTLIQTLQDQLTHEAELSAFAILGVERSIVQRLQNVFKDNGTSIFGMLFTHVSDLLVDVEAGSEKNLIRFGVGDDGVEVFGKSLKQYQEVLELEWDQYVKSVKKTCEQVVPSWYQWRKSVIETTGKDPAKVVPESVQIDLPKKAEPLLSEDESYALFTKTTLTYRYGEDTHHLARVIGDLGKLYAIPIKLLVSKSYDIQGRDEAGFLPSEEVQAATIEQEIAIILRSLDSFGVVTISTPTSQEQEVAIAPGDIFVVRSVPDVKLLLSSGSCLSAKFLVEHLGILFESSI